MRAIQVPWFLQNSRKIQHVISIELSKNQGIFPSTTSVLHVVHDVQYNPEELVNQTHVETADQEHTWA